MESQPPTEWWKTLIAEISGNSNTSVILAILRGLWGEKSLSKKKKKKKKKSKTKDWSALQYTRNLDPQTPHTKNSGFNSVRKKTEFLETSSKNIDIYWSFLKPKQETQVNAP